MKGIWKNEKSTRDRNAWKSFTRPGLKAKRTKVVMTVMCVLWITASAIINFEDFVLAEPF